MSESQRPEPQVESIIVESPAQQKATEEEDYREDECPEPETGSRTTEQEDQETPKSNGQTNSRIQGANEVGGTQNEEEEGRMKILSEREEETTEREKRWEEGYNYPPAHERTPYNTRAQAGKVILKPKTYEDYVSF